TGPLAEQFARATAAGPPLRPDEAEASQVVHGDVAGNVIVAPALPPAFIDISPGWRPAMSVDAQIVVEAVAWHRGAPALVEEAAGAVDGVAAVARACAFRLLCAMCAVAEGFGATEETQAHEAASFARVLDLVGA